MTSQGVLPEEDPDFSDEDFGSRVASSDFGSYTYSSTDYASKLDIDADADYNIYNRRQKNAKVDMDWEGRHEPSNSTPSNVRIAGMSSLFCYESCLSKCLLHFSQHELSLSLLHTYKRFFEKGKVVSD